MSIPRSLIVKGSNKGSSPSSLNLKMWNSSRSLYVNNYQPSQICASFVDKIIKIAITTEPLPDVILTLILYIYKYFKSKYFAIYKGVEMSNIKTTFCEG